MVWLSGSSPSAPSLLWHKNQPWSKMSWQQRMSPKGHWTDWCSPMQWCMCPSYGVFSYLGYTCTPKSRRGLISFTIWRFRIIKGSSMEKKHFQRSSIAMKTIQFGGRNLEMNSQDHLTATWLLWSLRKLTNSLKLSKGKNTFKMSFSQSKPIWDFSCVWLVYSLASSSAWWPLAPR